MVVVQGRKKETKERREEGMKQLKELELKERMIKFEEKKIVG